MITFGARCRLQLAERLDETLALNKLKELGRRPARLLCALLPSRDCRFSDIEIRSEDALTGVTVRPDALHIVRRELGAWRQAEGIELTHREITHVPSLVETLGGAMHVLKYSAHDTFTLPYT
jgi:hypothetical protein